MTWWCSAQTGPWTWGWQAYPGVWLFVIALAVGYGLAISRMLPQAGVTSGPAASRSEMTFFGLGVLTLWIALDWPIGALGAGYLLFVHQLQYVLLVMVAPPLLLLGTPVWLLTWLTDRRAIRPIAGFVSRPVQAIVICNAVVVLTHFPQVVDGLMPTQLGSFAIDLAWIGAGLILWWPALRRVPELNGLSYPARFGYLLAATLVPGIPAAFFFFAKFPIYRLYELAPPVSMLSAGDDQLIAGMVMKFGSFVIIILALSLLFFKWHAADRSTEGRLVLPTPAADQRTTIR